MTNEGLQRIEGKFLGKGDLFGLRYSEGTIFLEVDGWEQTKYEPYDGIGEVQPGEASGWQRLEDGSDDILYTEKTKKKVLHCAIGHSPSHFERFTNYPEGENRLRSLPNLGTPRPGDNYGYVDGNDSPYDMPTDVEELFIPPGVHLDFNFYNSGTEISKPVCSIVIREYNIEPIDPSTQKGRNAIRRVVSPGSPIPVGNVGNNDRQTNYDIQEHWDAEALPDAEIERIKGE